jgi:ferrous iron transport protein B
VKKILLMGNPNVGKSVVFSRLTGAKVIASNYPGTTVEIAKGILRIKGEDFQVIDVPGTYSLQSTSKAEQVAVKMLEDFFCEKEENDVFVINVIDSTNLERNFNLTLQLVKKRIPLIVALNFWDETKHRGIDINTEKLEKIIGVPCVPICAVSGEGIKNLVDRMVQAKRSPFDYDKEEKWHKIGDIVQDVQILTHRHHTLADRLGELSLNPYTGIPIAMGVFFITFQIIRQIGEGLIRYFFDPLFEYLWAPVMLKLSVFLNSKGFLHDILIGELIDGRIDFSESLGLLTTGFYVPLAAVLPYIFSFYLMLSLLEDSGYLPRLAVLVDTMMHKIGLHGYGIIPMVLGFGCNVPGVLSTRIMENKRERFLAATLMAVAIPCMSQIAMIMGLVGKEGTRGLFPVFGTLFLVWFCLGLILNKTLKGRAPEFFVEIPPYRIPYWRALLKKLWMRIVWFFKEAIPWVLFGIFLINILHTIGIINFIGNLVRPVISGILGLPKEAVAGLIVGILRKDVALGMLVPLNLTLKQLIIASVALTMYFPCAATFAVMLKEFGLKDMIKAAAIMMSSTLIVGGILNLLL